MVLIGMLKWWYSDGWLGQLSRSSLSLRKTADTFSIGLLIRTLFAPFHQISANETQREAGGKMNMLLDKLISRTIGFIARTFTILAGIIALTLKAVLGLLQIALWPLMPVMPVVGLILMSTVGAPWKLI